MRSNSLVLAVLLTLLMISGCSTPDRDLSLEMTKPFQTDAEMPISLSVREGGKALTGLQIHAVFEMQQMDHGSVDVEFTEQEDGLYLATGNFPMAGEWVAFVTVTDGEQSYEETIQITLKE